MTYKNIGPGVSQNPQATVAGGGQYSEEDRSYEMLVFQQTKPIADWEMNLTQLMLGNRPLNQKCLPSCWLINNFLERTDVNGSYLFLAPDPPLATTANRFQLRASDVLVNGWLVRFDFTESATAGINRITLPAPPNSGMRTDLVVLEVWRALVSPVPSVDNKSPTGQILRHGNAKAADGPPIGNTNLVDDILDPTFALETQKRVQIQYRYRVITGIDLTAYPDGLDDPSVLANTVPYLFASPVDGVATVYPYVKHTTDQGLWVAGSGDAIGSAALGTVDGFMYAVPICAVFRRNVTAFDRSLNMNGGSAMSTGVVTRPDGVYNDQIVAEDIKDLRKGITWDLHEVLTKTSQQLLDNNLTTEHETSALGTAGVSLFYKDDIGTSGHISNSDAVRMNFGDRSTTDSIVVKIAAAPAATFVSVQLDTLPISWIGPVNLLALAPFGTNIVSVGQIRFVDTAAPYDKDSFVAVSPYTASVVYSVAVGPAIDKVTVNFDVPLVAAIDVYIELLIEYPLGVGTARNMVGAYDFWTPLPASIGAWVDAVQFTATSDANRDSLNPSYWWVDPAHRELTARIPSISIIATYYADATGTRILIPEMLTGPVTINDGINPIYVTSVYTVNTNYTELTLSFVVPAATAVMATYNTLRAPSPVGAPPANSYNIFYLSRAVQSIQVPAGQQTLNLIPRAFSPAMHVISSGSGSPDDAFPYASPSSQISMGALPAANFPEARLNTPSPMSVSGFGMDSGYIQVPVYVPYTPSPSQVTLYKNAPDVTIDGDGRNFWPKSDNGATPVYAPSVYSQQLLTYQKHKVAYPVLMELKQDFTAIGRKGTFVLVVFTKWFDFDNQNSVQLSTITTDSAAAVYRVHGNMLNPRSVNT